MGELSSFFDPKSIAVIGASRTPGKIGHSVLANIIASGYKGELYPVNPKEDEILGYRCYRDIADLSGLAQIAVIAVPAPLVIQVAERCGQAGVKYLIVITAGFKEVGAEGLQRERELVSVCRRFGMRMVGPNCLGVMDTHAPYNASFSKDFALKGEIAFLSQSGALCLAILDWSFAERLGFSKFVSLGNKADLNEVDFIADAAEDEYSRVVLCYLEDVADGQRFLEVVGKAARKTPVVILKSGTSQAGARAASSHTGALAGSDVAYDIAFRQTGVVRAATMEELFDLATVFTSQPVPVSDRVAIVTNSGGPGIVATDRIEGVGLTMARFERETIDAMRAGLPVTANLYNPVDVIGDADAQRYRFALEHVLADPNVDAVVVLLTPTAVIDTRETARHLVEMKAKHPAKPVIASFIGGLNIKEAARLLKAGGVPNYVFPERAVGALAGLVRYGKATRKPYQLGTTEAPGKDPDRVRAVFDAVRADRRVVLLGSESAEVAAAYGIPVPMLKLARSADEAVQYAEGAGYPVVLKIASPRILHKTDVGGIKVGLKSADEVRRGYLDILESVSRLMPEAPVYGVEVQHMLPPGRECIVGLSKDVQFGPLIMFGLGGIYVNLLKDVSFRLVRGLNRTEIDAMIQETKAFELLRGFRGEKPADIPAVADTIARVAALVTDFPEISELDINPLFAYVDGVTALDVKITIS
ncbi:MAG: acetate--CoA ligase [Bacillota bacterium]|nr:acetate--CoA ligase [Bacillota bacterium]